MESFGKVIDSLSSKYENNYEILIGDINASEFDTSV